MISREAWRKYITRLTHIEKAAANDMLKFISAGGGLGSMTDTSLIDYAFALATKYGEASAAIAAEMYDAIAKVSGVSVPAAEVAETATFAQVKAEMVDKLALSLNDNLISSIPAKFAKQPASRTMLKNAKRDGAEYAWVPNGDTCAFCIMLASRGWGSGKDARGLDHIHTNCDCTYAVRFNGKGGVAGYDPDYYLGIYDDADGANWRDKLRTIRNEHDAENRDKINAQKRDAYALRQEALSGD